MDEPKPSRRRVRPQAGGFTRIDDSTWAAIRQILPQPWPVDAVRQDMRYWVGQERAWEATGGAYGVRCRPGRPALCACWGWAQKRARLLMADVPAWWDPAWGTVPPYAEGPAKGQPRASQGPETEPQVCADTEAEGQRRASEGPTKGLTRVQHRGTEAQEVVEDPSLSGEAIIAQQGQALSGQENPKPKKHADPMNAAQRAWVAETWQALQAIRGELQPGTRGQALTPPREAAMRGAARLLKAGGLTREDLYRAARWVYESPNPRAEGARATGDPVETLLRPSKLVTYCEVARDEEAGAVPVVEVAQAAPSQMTAEEREDMEMAAQYAKMDREAKAKLMDEWGDMPTGEDFEAAFREASTAQVDSRRSESDRVRDMVRRMRQWRDGTIGAQVLAFPAGGGR